MRFFFRGAGWLTLLFDAYLMLALVAMPMMKVEYLYLVPPFNSELARSTPGIVYTGLVFWTGFLAIGCLYSTKRRVQSEAMLGENQSESSSPSSAV